MTIPTPPVEVTVGDVEAFLADLMTRFGDDQVVWYRGHARAASWNLRASLARRGGLAMELELMAEFQRDATPLVERADLRGGDLSERDWLFLMQHYSVPTRLLDWSESPLAGVFFALDETGLAPSTEDACVWALLPQELNRLASLVPTQPWSVPLCGSSEDADRYLPSQIHVGSRDLKPMAVTATRRFDRIRAQTGVFTIMHKNDEPLESTSQSTLVKYVVPASAKDHIRRQLARLGMHASVMYPDLEHLGRRVAERLA